ncbi:hypothetical protein [Paenimyroides aestuarii]|uniref:Uncharacterized protein n=1 Tax=Paenimyroides aestuarii TaxID=2968490 RepID=A0ABY5NV67_9FLAO|nr:hypothetical protein [Paenimyroides aestuarii]UUV22337.1 hypothetical protein NPX36_04680 [Paenimyroides aestuarii]
MRKITMLAALCGSAYFANAQVGIGTSEPASSTMLEIKSSDKGVLIPRVSLTETDSFSGVTGTEIESLLVYNTANSGTGSTAVSPGFYYWTIQNGTTTAHWERIVNQSQLDEAISNITDVQADLNKIINLLKVAFPANNLVDPAVTGDTFGGGMVFTPGTNPTIEYVYFDGTNYTKKDITTDIIAIIKGNESKTKIVTINNKQYYVSESYTGTADPVTGTETGVYQIDVIGGVVNNFNEFINSTVGGGGTNYSTVEEYIEYISENVTKTGETRIVIDTSVTPNQASFEQWNGTTWVTVPNTAFSTIVKSNETITTLTAGANATYTYKNEAGVDVTINIPTAVVQNLDTIINASTSFSGSTSTTLVQYIQEMIDNTDLPEGIVTASITGGNIMFNIIDASGTPQAVPATAFSDIVKANESLTTLAKSTNNSAYVQVTADPKAAQKVVYEYLTENATIKNYMDVTADVEWSIENNTDVQNAIEDIVNNLLNEGGNVYFTRTEIAAGTPAGQLTIPAFSFYTINNTTGVKELVDIAQTIVNAITNATAVQKQEIKNQLGDVYNESTVVNTGDTWIDGGKIYTGVYAATVTGNTANVSTITIIPAAGTTIGKIVSIKLLNTDNSLINTSTTDIALTGNNLSFKIGTGNMYNVLSTSNLNVKAVVEFSAQ